MSETENQHRRRIEEEAGLPHGTLDEPLHVELPSDEQRVERTWVSHLRKTKSWGELEKVLGEEAANLARHLIMARQGSGETEIGYLLRQEAIRGEIRGMLRVLDAPTIAERSIMDQRLPRNQ